VINSTDTRHGRHASTTSSTSSSSRITARPAIVVARRLRARSLDEQTCPRPGSPPFDLLAFIAPQPGAVDLPRRAENRDL